MFNLGRFAAAAALFFAGTALAFEPSEGTIAEGGAGQITATGGPYTAVNPTPTGGAADLEPVCSPSGVDCDEFLLTLDLSEGFRSANPDFVIQVDLAFEGPSDMDGMQTDDIDLYVYDDQDNIIGQSASSGNPESTQVPISDIPSTARIVAVLFNTADTTATLDVSLVRGAAAGGADPCEASDEATEEGAIVVDPAVAQDLTFLGNAANYGAFVHFNSGTQKQHDALVSSLGLFVVGDYRQYSKAMFLHGPVPAFFALMNNPMVSRIEHNKPIRLLGDTQSWATRVRVAQEAVSGGPYRDSQGRIVTGQGVTLGVIDSGLQGSHADFSENLLHNFKLVNFVVGDVADPDGNALVEVPQYADVGTQNSENAAGGHGTHVTGTVAGRGNESGVGLYPMADVAPFIEGSFTGAAPDSQVIHWAHGAGLFVLSAVTAYEHMLANLETFDPPLVAVNNSYGAGPGPYNPGDVASCLIKDIVEAGVVMAFAAGNDGDGNAMDETRTSPTCKDPTPGVICVASYNDQGSGDRNAPLSGFSSRGLIEFGPTDYPDIAAPGDTITSTCLQGDGTQAICTGGESNAAETQWAPWYGTISGTSMATPHITGIIGLMKQVDPTLTPAEIEDIIQDTARKVGDGYEPDPQNPGSTIHHGYGAGLVDMPAILDALGARADGLPTAGEEFIVFDGDNDTGDAGDVVTLTMQDETVDGVTGITYRLTVADASSGTPVSYQIDRNVAGLPFSTTVVLNDATTAVAAEPGPTNNSIAQSVSVAGNVISAFVPYLQQGAPGLNEPVHNVRVIASGDLGVVDVAPSASGDTLPDNVMYGRAFTIQLPAGTPPPSNERTCELPGFTMMTSPVGLTGNGTPSGQEDVRQAWVAEPTDLPGTVVFSIKVDNLSPQPVANHRWYYYFSVPGDDTLYWVNMDTTTGVPTFNYGSYAIVETGLPVLTGLGTFETLGTISDASTFTTDGLITLVMDKAQFGLQAGDALTALAVSVRQTTNPANGAGLTVDSAAAQNDYTLVGNDTCAAPSGVTGVVDVEQPGTGTPAVASGGAGGSFGAGLLALLLLGGLARRRLR